MKNTLLARIVMLCIRRAWISFGAGKELLRRMNSYEECWHSGAALPTLPKMLRRQMLPAAIWAAFLVCLKQPSVFALGVFLFVPAALITCYWLALRLASLALPWIGG